jgi:hypothetical protein
LIWTSRPASQVIARVRWQGRLPAGMEWNDGRGDLDGVVSLRTVARRTVGRRAMSFVEHTTHRIAQSSVLG